MLIQRNVAWALNAVLVVGLGVVNAGCSQKSRIAEKGPSLTVFKGVRVIDGSSAVPRDNASIVIRDGFIESIQDENGALPPEAVIVDMSGKTVMPALIAAHAHLGITKGVESGASQITEENVLRQLKKYADFGVGTVASLGTDHDFIYGIRERRKKGLLAAPYLMTAGRGFGVANGAPPVAMGMDQVYRPTRLDDVKTDVQELVAHQPDVIKIWVDDFNHTVDKKMDPEFYRTIIKEAHARGIKVVAHVYYLADAKRLAKDGVDFFGHSVRDKPVDRELIRLMKKNNVAYIPTLALDDAAFIYASKPAWMESEFFKRSLDSGMEEWLRGPSYKAKPISRANLKTAQQNLAKLHKEGVRIGFGTDSGAALNRLQGFSEHRELELMVEAGLTPMQALQSATSVNASMLGLADERGVIAAGKKADLLVLNDNPLDDIRNTRKIDSVWLEGVRQR